MDMVLYLFAIAMVTVVVITLTAFKFNRSVKLRVSLRSLEPDLEPPPKQEKVAEAGVDTIDLSSWVGNNFGACGLRSAAESGAVGLDFVVSDPRLASLIEWWPRLSDAVRAAIVGLVGSREDGTRE